MLALAVVSALIGSLSIVAPSEATIQYGCSFSAPTPVISGGLADMSLSANCSSSPGSGYTDRRLVIDLMGSDPYADDWLEGAVRDTWTQKNYSWSFLNWTCNEDIGTDEIYSRVRVEVWEPGYGWHHGSWVTSSVVPGNCS